MDLHRDFVDFLPETKSQKTLKINGWKIIFSFWGCSILRTFGVSFRHGNDFPYGRKEQQLDINNQANR